MNPADDDRGVPVSQRIRERLRAARERFHANDNISRFIEPQLDRLPCGSLPIAARGAT